MSPYGTEQNNTLAQPQLSGCTSLYFHPTFTINLNKSAAKRVKTDYLSPLRKAMNRKEQPFRNIWPV